MNILLPKIKQGSQERDLILMTRRKSYQKGSIDFRDGIAYLRIRELDHHTGIEHNRRIRLGEFKNEKSARLFADPIIADINKRNNTAPAKLHQDMIFTNFIDRHFKSYEESNRHQPTTRHQRKVFLDRHLIPAFGSKKLREVTPIHISDFLDSLSGYSSSTRSGLYSLLRLIFEIAEQFDLVDKSPVRPKRHRPKSERVEKPVLTAEQIGMIIDRMESQQERLLVFLLSATGLRINEALGLRWVDFQAEQSLLHVRHSLYKGELKQPKTKASKASIRLAPDFAALLENHRRSVRFSEDQHMMFCRPDGTPLCYNSLRNHLHAALVAIGIKPEANRHGFHIFRHSAGTLLFKKKRDLKLVQDTLRHATVDITSEVYLHMTDQLQSEGSQALFDEIAPNCTLLVPSKAVKAG